MIEKKTIALFGGTGNTGKLFKQIALDNGYKLRVMVRKKAPSDVDNSNLVFISGDFSNFNAIKETIEGSDIVVCMGSALKSNDSKLMSNFMAILYNAMKETGVKHLIYQAGALNYLPNKKKDLSVWLMRNTIGKFSGAISALLDHERVFELIESEIKNNGIKVLVTLPGALGLTPGDSKKELKINKSISWTQSRYVDVANFTVNIIENENYWNKYLYIA